MLLAWFYWNPPPRNQNHKMCVGGSLIWGWKKFKKSRKKNQNIFQKNFVFLSFQKNQKNQEKIKKSEKSRKKSKKSEKSKKSGKNQKKSEIKKISCNFFKVLYPSRSVRRMYILAGNQSIILIPWTFQPKPKNRPENRGEQWKKVLQFLSRGKLKF